MPRTLNADLSAAMDSGIFKPYFNIQLMDVDRTTVMYETEDVLAFELDGLNSTIKFHDPTYHQDFYTFRIQRGVYHDGAPIVVTSSNYWPITDRHHKRIRTLQGHVFPNKSFSSAGDVTYHSIIDTICAQYGFTAEFHNPAAAWLNYQFLADGMTMTLHNARYFFTMLRVKYLIFATDYDEDHLYFYQAISTLPAFPGDYTLINARSVNAPGAGATRYRYLVSKDEAGVVHNSGVATNPVHNLGYLESTASHPGRTWYVDTPDWIIQGIQPHLKYLDFDALRVSYDVVGQGLWPVRVREVYSTKLDPSWQWQARVLDVFGDTEGGALPAETIAAISYVPLNVSNFSDILDANDTNLQVAMESLDQHDHPFICREILTANRTYYVRTDGDDANTGLANTAGGAFLTIQHAIDTAASIDTSVYDITIQLADGTYVAMDEVILKDIHGSGIVTINGNDATPSNVVIDACLAKYTPGTNYYISHVKFDATNSGADSAIYAANYAYIYFGHVVFGSSFGTYHLCATAHGTIQVTANYTISASVYCHVAAYYFGLIFIYGVTITFTDNPVIDYFCEIQLNSAFRATSCTFSGASTGKRFHLSSAGVIRTGTGSLTYFPGDTAGDFDTGGQYDDLVSDMITLLDVYPVGAIYISVVSTSPATLFGGTWSAFGQGKVLVGIDVGGDADFDVVEETGGAKTVTVPQHAAKNTDAGVDTSNHPSGTSGTHLAAATHVHNITAYTHTASSVVQPYIVVYMWKRTA